MTEEENAVPNPSVPEGELETSKLLDSDDRTGNIESGIELMEMKIERGEAHTEASKALKKIKEAKTALDLGSGHGGAAESLLKACPNIEELVTVDAKEIITYIDNPRDVKIRENKGVYINPYLEENQEKFNIITLSNVPKRNHLIKDYNRIADALSEDGVLIQVGDTQLDRTSMRKAGLEVAYNNREVFIVWQKKDNED